MSTGDSLRFDGDVELVLKNHSNDSVVQIASSRTVRDVSWAHSDADLPSENSNILIYSLILQFAIPLLVLLLVFLSLFYLTKGMISLKNAANPNWRYLRRMLISVGATFVLVSVYYLLNFNTKEVAEAVAIALMSSAIYDGFWRTLHKFKELEKKK